MLSYWEQQSFTRYNHVIIGGGLVGISVALELRLRFTNDSILVLERGLLPTGATTRNAGFACTGSVMELLDDLKTDTEAAVASLFAARRSGLKRLRARLGDAAIGYYSNGSHELLTQHELPALEQIDYLNKLLHPVTGSVVFRESTKQLDAFGFSRRYAAASIENVGEGELNSGQLMQALLRKAREENIEVRTGAALESYEEEAGYVSLRVAHPHRNQSLQLRAGTLSFCTNAFAKELLPNVDVTPGRGQVLITEPIPGLRFKGIYHMHHGYYYFRELDGRVLLGGGRHLDFTGENTTDFGPNETILKDLEQQLREVILPTTSFSIAAQWSGIMAFGQTKQPIVKAFSSRTFGAFRMGGMGVALGSEVAARLAGIIEEQLA